MQCDLQCEKKKFLGIPCIMCEPDTCSEKVVPAQGEAQLFHGGQWQPRVLHKGPPSWQTNSN